MLFVIWVCSDDDLGHPSIHLVDETGALAHSAPSLELALRWLWSVGEREVVASTRDGPELFLIEACGSPTLTLPSPSIRRELLGSCARPPRLLGLGGDPPPNVRTRKDRGETPGEARRRRARWYRRAASP